ncbi:MAG TPA: hypothetical protein VGB85_03575 [Nannocystis sp.]|jgi:hypothetical protein
MTDEPRSLVRVEAARLPDAYEEKFMAGEGTVLYRDKRRAPWPAHALLGAAALAVIAVSVASGELLALAIALPVLAMIWVLFAVLRVTVSAGVVTVQYGIFGPEIPVAAIELCEATTYDWKRFGGWGIRRGRGGEWIYNMPGDGGHAVRIVWRDRKGRRRVTLIGSRHADQLASTIRGARAALPAAPGRAALPDGED